MRDGKQGSGTIVSRFGGLAAIDSTGHNDLPADEWISEGGNLRLDEPDSPLGSIGVKQHRRRPGRLSTGEFRQFLGMARGSNCELQTQLEIARTLKYGDLRQIEEADGLSHEVGKMLYAMLVKTKGIDHRSQVTEH